MKKYMQRSTLWSLCAMVIPVTVSGVLQHVPLAQKTSTVFSTAVSTCKSISELEPYIPLLTKHDLVALDFDNTLFRPASKNHVGSDEWFRKGLDYLKGREEEQGKAFDVMLSIYNKVQSSVVIEPVEGDKTLDFLRKIQATGCLIIILTARSVIEQTFSQIKTIDFDFAKHAPPDELCFRFAEDREPIVYKKGILFCGNNNKGNSLFRFLAMTHVLPSTIYFMDDRIENIFAVYQSCVLHGVVYKGFHYVYLEQEIKNYVFDPSTLKTEKKCEAVNPWGFFY